MNIEYSRTTVRKIFDWPVLIPVVVTFLCLVGFVGKAFHIDDPLFLWSARQIQAEPADFYGFEVNWYRTNELMAGVINHPPLVPYFIAAVTAFSGPSEVMLHIIFLIPAIAAAAGTYCLAKNFCSHPVIAALAAVLTPVFLVSSTNVMVDTTMLALWVWAVFFWITGFKTDKHLKLAFSALLICACAMTKYFGIALVVLLFAYSIMQRRRVGLWALFLLIPLSVMVGYELITYKLYGRGVLSAAASFAVELGWEGGAGFLSKVFTGLAFAGGCMVTALFFIPLVWSLRVMFVGIFLAILFIIVFSFVEKIGTFSIPVAGVAKWSFLLQFGLMTVTGISLLGLAVVDFGNHRDPGSLLLLLWVLGTLVFVCFINWTINARTILPIAPAAGILLARRVEQLSRARQRIVARHAVLPLICAAIVSLALCWSDYTWAGTQRMAASQIGDRFDNYKGQVWFQGHWGFQYYMQARGFKAFDFEVTEAKRDDILIIPSNNCFTEFVPRESVSFVEVLEYPVCGYLTTMDKFLGAGFYADVIGPLPFAIGQVRPEQYYVYVFR